MLLQELRSPTGKVYLELNHLTGADWLHVDWIGYPTAANVVAGSSAYLGHIAGLGLHGLLNDNRRLVGRWDSSLEWIRDEWMPQARRSGVRYLANLSHPGVMAADSAAAMQAMVGNDLQMRLFTDYAEAEQWLQRMGAMYSR